MKAQIYPKIIERIEWVRRYLSLNKSQFSHRIGITPQTYNNIIGPGNWSLQPNIKIDAPIG